MFRKIESIKNRPKYYSIRTPSINWDRFAERHELVILKLVEDSSKKSYVNRDTRKLAKIFFEFKYNLRLNFPDINLFAVLQIASGISDIGFSPSKTSAA